MKTFAEVIEKVIAGMDQASQDHFYSSVTSKVFPKNELLLREREVCRHTFVVEEGCLRRYYLKDGMEITSEFIFSGEMAVDHNA